MGMQVKDGDVSCLVGEEEELVLRREVIRPREREEKDHLRKALWAIPSFKRRSS